MSGTKKTYRKTKLRSWRKYRGITLAKLADKTHTTHATLSRLERGLQPYGQELLEHLALALRTDPATLISSDPPKKR
jgi:transcriptional regulator with XRE-family HTH domain